MSVTKDNLKIKENNNIFDVFYNNEAIYRTDKLEKINYDLILSSINKVEEKSSGINQKIKKILNNN